MAEHGRVEPQAAKPASPVTASETAATPAPQAAALGGPALILALQRSAGNARVARLLGSRPDASGRIQRGTRIFGVSIGEDEELTVQEVIDRQDADLIDNLPTARLLGASQDQKLTLLRLLAGQWAGDEDERLMETIWGSFGDPVAVADAQIELWKLCVARGADLDELQVVQDARTEYEQDVKALARSYLAENRRYVEQEKERLGISSRAGEQGGSTEEQRAAVQELQTQAAELSRAQQARDKLQEVTVGYDLVPEARPGLVGMGTTTPQEHAEDVVARRGRRMLQPATFDPFRPPHHMPFGDEQPAMASYERVKAYDKELGDYLAGFAARYPAIYALIREGRLGEVGAEGTSPEQAQAIVAQVLDGTLQKIAETGPKIDSGDLDWRDLTPIHQQLRAGAAGGAGHNWSGPFRRWVADDLLEGHQAQQFWVQLGLTSLAAAAFVVASLATAGTATFFIAAGIGLGITAGQAAYAWENYEDLQSAADTSMSRETQMVTQGQASAEMIRATVETVIAFLAAFGLGARALRALGGATAALEGEAALMAGARSRIAGRIAYMERRVADTLAPASRGGRTTVTAAREGLEQIHEGALRDANAIRNGRIAEFADLPAPARNQLAEEYLEQVGRTWRDAQQRLARAAEAAEAPRVVPPDPAARPGSPSTGFGHPPARRPPPTRGGTGWEDW